MIAIAAAFCGAAMTLAACYGAGRWLTRSIELPESVRFATGGAAISVLVFALLAMRIASLAPLAAIGLCGVLLLVRDRPTFEWNRPPVWMALPAAVYGVLYLIFALAPEVQSDALNYHLTLGVEAKRSGGFPSRIGFYEVLPQGVETLFAMAYSVGGEVAAKLVHLSFLVLTIPLLAATAKLLGIPAPAAWAAGLFYAITPVVGVSSVAAYNDAAMAFYVFAVFYLLVAWWRKKDDRMLWPLGLCAGFCYAIKLTGGIVPPVVLALIVVGKCRPWKALAAIALVAGPWMARAALLTHNPFAPMFNRFFPNPYFHVFSEQELARFLRTYGDVDWRAVPLELTMYGDLLQGLLGPMWLALPLALLALRQRAGRLVSVAAVIVAAPWLLNIGTRFLIPSLPFAALALFMSMPRMLVAVLLLAQAVVSWPHVIYRYAPSGTWALDSDIPWAAALGVEDAGAFGRRTSVERNYAELVEKNTKPSDRIFELGNAPAAITPRQLVSAWQSALGDRLVKGLWMGVAPERGALVEWRSRFEARRIRAVRIRFAGSQPTPAAIQEVQLFDATGQKLTPNVLWSLVAWPNIWDAPLVLDRNLVTAWSTWEPVRTGMFLDIELPGSVLISEVRVIGTQSAESLPLEIFGNDGGWVRLPVPRQPEKWPELNLRRHAVRMLRRERITHVLAARGSEASGRISRDMIEHAADWDMEPVATYDTATLLRLK